MNDKCIKITNNGLFVAKFTIRYLLNGEKKLFTSKEFFTGEIEKFMIPDAATNIHLIVDVKFAFSSWNTILEKKFETAISKSYNLRY